MGENSNIESFVLGTMRLAERAHRTRPQGPHHRKPPTSAFTKLDRQNQLNKCVSLYEQVFDGHVPEKLTARYQAALNEFRATTNELNESS